MRNTERQGAGDSLMKQHQCGFAPRLGIAYSPISKLTVRTGFGMYYDRGELFSDFSPSAGGGFNGPFGVTLAPPFVQPVFATTGATLANPFGPQPPPTPAGSAAAFTAQLPNLAQTVSGFRCLPPGTPSVRSCSAATTSTTSCRTRRTGASICNTSSPIAGCSVSATSAITARTISCPFPSTSRISPPRHIR